jgi:hypothetical protein
MLVSSGSVLAWLDLKFQVVPESGSAKGKGRFDFLQRLSFREIGAEPLVQGGRKVRNRDSHVLLECAVEIIVLNQAVIKTKHLFRGDPYPFRIEQVLKYQSEQGIVGGRVGTSHILITLDGERIFVC